MVLSLAYENNTGCYKIPRFWCYPRFLTQLDKLWWDSRKDGTPYVVGTTWLYSVMAYCNFNNLQRYEQPNSCSMPAGFAQDLSNSLLFGPIVFWRNQFVFNYRYVALTSSNPNSCLCISLTNASTLGNRHKNPHDSQFNNSVYTHHYLTGQYIEVSAYFQRTLYVKH